MNLWFKARRMPLLAAGLALYATIAHAAGSHVAMLPTLSSAGTIGVPVMLFAPLPACAALMFCLGGGAPGAEGTASRRIAGYDQLAVSVSGLAALGIGYAVSVIRSAPVAEASGRNMLFLTGLMLCARWLWDDRVAVLSGITWVILVTLVGFDAMRQPRPWTIIGLPPRDPVGFALSLALFALGVLLLARRRRTRSPSG